MPARVAGKGTRVKADVHVLIVEEDGIYNATCLEMGLAAAGPDLPTVRRDMLEIMAAHLTACEKEKRPQDAFVPAPAEYWRVYYEAIKAGVCRTTETEPQPSGKPRSGDPMSYLDVRSFVCASR